MNTAVFWFTNDLRINDNPGLIEALEHSDTSAIYIHDPNNPWPAQGAAAWWLHHSLNDLAANLHTLSIELSYSASSPLAALQELRKHKHFTHLYCSRAYLPYEREHQRAVAEWCKDQGIEFRRFGGSLLLEPENVNNLQGTWFKVFTPFYKYYLKQHLRKPKLGPSHRPKPRKSDSKQFDSEQHSSKAQSKSKLILALDELELLPTTYDWASNFFSHWQTGENAALETLKSAIEHAVCDYREARDQLGLDGTSNLSMHLRFGEISPATIWQEVSQSCEADACAPFLRQLVWRDFSFHLLFHNPHITDSCYNEKFNHFPWHKNNEYLIAWQKGETGYPIVDAAMMQLWHTGWMHNRARMIVASFLTKHLMQPWQEGAKWFWDTLLDADLANNTAGWQWTAGCGADAAPFFRIFNPITQGQKFDKDGSYVRQWLPQLSKLPNKYLHQPWLANEEELESAGVQLGKNYPRPIVDHATARKKALDAYKHLQG